MKLRNLQTAVTHGLVAHRVLDRCKRAGIAIEPFYLFVEGVAPVAVADRAGFEATLLSPADAARLAHCRPGDGEQARNGERFASGHVCVALEHRGEIAAFTWANPNEIGDGACPARLAAHEAYLYDAYTRPEYRGRGLAPLLRVRCYEALRPTGKTAFLSITACSNTPAVRFKRKLGARPVMLYLSIKIAGRRLGVWTLRDARRGQPS